jgi:hypothetical protein
MWTCEFSLLKFKSEINFIVKMLQIWEFKIFLYLIFFPKSSYKNEFNVLSIEVVFFLVQFKL